MLGDRVARAGTCTAVLPILSLSKWAALIAVLALQAQIAIPKNGSRFALSVLVFSCRWSLAKQLLIQERWE